MLGSWKVTEVLGNLVLLRNLLNKGLIGILLRLNYSNTAITPRSAGARLNKISIRLLHRDLHEPDSLPGLPAQKLDEVFYLSSCINLLRNHPA